MDFWFSKHFSMHHHFSSVSGVQTAHSAVCLELWGGKNRMVLIINCFSSTQETTTYFQILQEHWSPELSLYIFCLQKTPQNTNSQTQTEKNRKSKSHSQPFIHHFWIILSFFFFFSVSVPFSEIVYSHMETFSLVHGKQKGKAFPHYVTPFQMGQCIWKDLFCNLSLQPL